MSEATLKKIANAIGQAERYEPPDLRAPAAEPMATTPLDPEPGEANEQGIGPGAWLPNRLGLPDGCPVHPLGYNGDTFFFLDTQGQLRALKDKDFGQKVLDALFMGRHNFLLWAWPKTNSKDKVTGYRAEKAGPCLQAACAAKGAWSPVDRIRGRGAWLGAKKDLILHTGSGLWINGREMPTGELGRYVYPTRPPIMTPWPTRIDEEGNPAKLLVPLFRRWNWARPDVDPVLLLGWVGCAMIGGALDHRPAIYVTGDKGTGKSSLQAILKGLFGEALIQTTNTTAAGIYQRIGQDSLPIAIDEFEAKDHNGRAKAILELARQAYSGGLMFRGSDGHVGVEFQSRSAFLFSSINAPPLEPQDLSRMALLRLHKLNVDSPPPEIDAEDLERLGRMVLRRMIDQWHRFATTWQAYAAELKEAGHDGRGQATFATLLAAADCIVGESFDADEVKVPMGEDLSIWRERLKASEMGEFEDAVENWRLCLSHLLTVPVDAWRGGAKLTIGHTIEEFFGRDIGAPTYKETRERLAQAGLGLVEPRKAGDPHWLAVPSQSPQVWGLYKGTKWAGEPGAGVWASALKQGPKGSLWDSARVRVNGDLARCTLISLEALYGRNGLMVEEVDRKYS